MTPRKTNEQFLSELKRINSTIIPMEEYATSATPIRVRCSICGHEWKSRPNTLLRGYGCPQCAGNKKKTDDEFRKELAVMNPAIDPLEVYQGNKTAILCRCRVCGHEWKASPNNLLSKHHKCPKCSHKRKGRERRKSNDEFLQELSEINPQIVPLEEYTTSQRKIRCQCKKCGCEWKATPNNLLDKKSRCPHCSHASTSVIEQLLYESFSVTLGDGSVLPRDKKAIGKELDIFIPSLNMAIEYGAWYWHKDRLSKDEEKIRLCSNKGITLYTIYEDCQEEMENKPDQKIYYYTENISNEPDYHTARSIIKWLFERENIPFDKVEHEWDSIISRSVDKARRMTDQDFTEWLTSINPTVELIEPFQRYIEKVKCRCKVCGHEWSALPSSLLYGHACLRCARRVTGEKKTITDEEFRRRLSLKNPNVEPLEPYIRGIDPISFHCKKCGNVWKARPTNLLQRNGCPVCGKKSMAQKQGKSIRCIETGEIYESIAEAQRLMGVFNVHKCANGQQKTAGGFHWEYIE